MWTRKGKRVLALAAAAVLLIAGACGMLAARREDAALDERTVRKIMDGTAAASYAFMGGSCRIYEYGEEYLGVIFHERSEEARSGQVQFGKRILSAEEYHGLYGDTETDMPYSEEEKAYTDEMGNLYRTRSVPTHSFPFQSFPEGEGMLNVWTMSKQDFEAFLADPGVSITYDNNGGHWGALLEPIQ